MKNESAELSTVVFIRRDRLAVRDSRNREFHLRKGRLSGFRNECQGRRRIKDLRVLREWSADQGNRALTHDLEGG